jgi:hypothetical protein
VIFIPAINVWTPEFEWPEWMRRRRDAIIVASAVFSADSGPTVDTSVITNHSTFRTPTAPCSCDVRCDNDGEWRESTNTGGFPGTSGTWLTSGLNSEVWIERTIDSGSLDGPDPGAGRLICSTTRTYGIDRGAPTGTDTCTLTFDFWDAATGGSNIGTKQITLTADYDDGS